MRTKVLSYLFPWLSWLIVLALILPIIVACEQKKAGTAAPLNDIATLEKLAQAYKEVAEQFPVNPVNLAPNVRRKFVEQVFSSAGFGYSETLTSLSLVKKENITKLHRDMQELLFMPHYRLQQDSMKDIYTEQELLTIQKITTNFK